MAGIHYVFRRNPKDGELSLLDVAQTIHEAKAIKEHHIKQKHYLPASIMIMELVG
jgi:hypothetical protein